MEKENQQIPDDQASELSDFQRALIRDRYLNPKQSQAELGKKYGIKRAAISEHLKNPLVKRELLRLHNDVFEGLKALQLQAVKNLAYFLDPEKNKNDRLRYEATRDILGVALASPNALPDAPAEVLTFDYESERKHASVN